jgi:hypothetical protein
MKQVKKPVIWDLLKPAHLLTKPMRHFEKLASKEHYRRKFRRESHCQQLRGLFAILDVSLPFLSAIALSFVIAT